MIKKFLYTCSLFLALLFTGCAQEDWLNNPNGDVPDRDYAELQLAVSEPQTVRTRAGYDINDSHIGSATVLIYKGNSALGSAELLQGETFYAENSNTSLTRVKIAYNDAVKSYCRTNSEKVYLFVVANYDFGGSYPATVRALFDKLDSTPATSIPMLSKVTMAGCAGETGETTPGTEDVTMVSKGALNSLVTVKMARNLARAYVESKVDDFELEEYKICSAAPEGLVCGGLTGGVSVKGMGSNAGTTVDGEAQVPSKVKNKKNYVYAFGQKAIDNGTLGSDNRAYVIVKGIYAGDSWYYRIDLRKKKTTGTGYDYLYLTPNHEYQISITGVKAKGYATEAEAAKHPQDDLLTYDIYDRVPSVLSMIGDGQHELGVETPVTLSGSTGSFALKLTSKITGTNEYPANMALSADGKTIVSRDAQNKADGKLKIEVISGDEWLRLTGIGSPSDSDDGNLYDVNVKSVSNLSVGQLTGEVRVTWMGLSRDVEIVWDQPFNIESIMSAKLEMDNNGTTTTVPNYWKFLDENYSGTHAMGISKSMNCGNIRNEGIHLPVGIGGENSGNYSYKYTLTLAGDYKTKKLKSVKIYNKQNGTEIVPQELSFTQGTGSTATTITLIADANSLGRQYFTGRLQLIFEENGEEEQLPDIDVYHTGFFWNVTSSDGAYTHAISGKKPTTGWYYYEIRTFGNRMWLDRNICAKSSGMAIISNANGGSMYIPDGTGDFKSEAIGSYYLPAAYNTSKESAEKHLYTNICPPGFRIPKTNEWDEIRNSNAFRSTETEAGGYTYFQARLRDDDGNMIYLPKGMYYNGSTLVGDDRAGYFWTATEAAGLEKDQIGRWLQALMLSGGSNSYMYGNIEDYGMQIRAVEIDDTPVKKYTIGFKVKGATHVYIYDATKAFELDEDTEYRDHNDAIKSGLMAWPGIAIGEASTMSSYYRENKFYKATSGSEEAREYTFTYTTTTNPDNLRFVFSYMEKGKLYVYSLNANGDGPGAAQYNGWPLLEHYYFGFTNKSAGEYHWDAPGWTPPAPPEVKKYKFYFYEKPTNQNQKPDSDAKGGAIQTLPDGQIRINSHWTSGWSTETKGSNGHKYYVYTLETSDEFDEFRFNWRFGDASNPTYSAVGGVANGPKVSKDYLVWNDAEQAYCVTINDLRYAVKGVPTGNEMDIADYRIYYPNTATKLYMWYGASSTHVWQGGNANYNSNTHGAYYYADFTFGNVDEQFHIDYGDGSKNVLKPSQFTYDATTKKKCAYVDADGVAHQGVPSAVVVEEKHYRLYWPKTFGQMYVNYIGGGNLFTGSTDPSSIKDGEENGYYYKNFDNDDSANETRNINYSSGWQQDHNTGITLNDFVKDSTSGKWCAYIDDSYVGHGGKPKAETEETRNFRIYWDKSHSDLYYVYIRLSNGTVISDYTGATGYDDNNKWFYKDFSVKAKPSEFNTWSIYADFRNGDKTIKYQRSSNSGDIYLNEFKLKNGRYEFGQDDDAMRFSNMKQI